MKRLSICCLVSLMTLGSMQAQTSNLLDRHQETLSPSETRFGSHAEDMNVRRLRQLYSNPAFYEWVHSKDATCQKGSNQAGGSNFSKYATSKDGKYSSALYTGYAMGEQDGDFLHYEGNASHDYRVGAFGEYSIRDNGTIFGKVRYSRGVHEGIGWSAMRSPELYLPYISTDSIGGDFKYEDYQIEGGYAFTLNEWKIGVYGSFHGEQAHRMTDPRALNNTTWLNIGAGISRMYNGHLLMAQGTFGRNKQNMSLRYWRPGEQDRFFVSYGFGLYDVRQSKVAFGYSRMYYIMESSARFTYQSPTDRPFTVYASLGYEYDRMKTEETNICDLYFSKTHTLLPSVMLNWKPSESWKFSWWTEGRIDLRKGFENIFERYQSDVDNNIYDYRMVDTQQNYKMMKMNALTQIRAQYQFNGNQQLGLTGGVSMNMHDEKYRNSMYSLKNGSIFPHGKVDYHFVMKKSEIELSCLYGQQLLTDNKYNVVMRNNDIQHLDFQHAFQPYAYRNSTFSSIQASAAYTYHLKKCALGMKLKFMYTRGDRADDCIYTGKIGYESTAPSLSVKPDKHDETWGSASVYLVF